MRQKYERWEVMGYTHTQRRTVTDYNVIITIIDEAGDNHVIEIYSTRYIWRSNWLRALRKV